MPYTKPDRFSSFQNFLHFRAAADELIGLSVSVNVTFGTDSILRRRRDLVAMLAVGQEQSRFHSQQLSTVLPGD